VSYRDLQSFLKRLEQEGQLVYVHEEILPEPDVRMICRAAADMPDGPAVVMDNIKGYRGRRVVVNVHGSWANHALLLGLPKTAGLKEQFYAMDERWVGCTGEVKRVDNPVCQEVVITEGINLFHIIPLFRVNKYDGGCYFSKAAVISKDPEDPDNFDKVNVGMYRLQVQGPDIIGMQTLAFHDLAVQLRKAEESNRPLLVAVALGVDPFLALAACTPLRYDESEYKFAAGLSRVPQEVARAVTCDLDVPVNAEYVIEGEVIPRRRSPEGPFGEMPGSYSGVRRQVQIKVKAVTHRKDPIFENLYVGRPWTEHDTLIGLATSVPLYRQLKETMPEVVAVNALYQHGLTAIVATGSKFGGYAKSVAFRLASTTHGIAYCKNIILVDENVDPFDLVQVMWALSTRVRPDKDVVVVPNTPGMPLDPSSDPPGMGGKLIIDATTPAPPDRLMREVRMVENFDAGRYRKLLSDLQTAAGRERGSNR